MLICILAGCAMGFLAGLGVGGGSLLILWLTAVTGMEPQTARIVNLLFFLPSAGISLYFRRKQGTVDIRRLLPAIVSGAVAALIFSWLGTMSALPFLRKIFGIFLIFSGMNELKKSGERN